MQRALADRRLPALILDLVAWSEAGDWRGGESAGRPIGAFARERLDRAWKRVRRPGKSLGTLAAEDRHRLRIEMKKLRYATEFFAGLAPRHRRRERAAFTGHLRDLQERFGELNDLETRRQLAPQLFEGDDEAFQAEVARLVDGAVERFGAMREMGPYWG